MNTVKTVFGNGGAEIKVEAKEWKKEGQHRIYFTETRRNGGQACWDVNKGDFVKVHGEFGPTVKASIKKEFNL